LQYQNYSLDDNDEVGSDERAVPVVDGDNVPSSLSSEGRDLLREKQELQEQLQHLKELQRQLSQRRQERQQRQQQRQSEESSSKVVATQPVTEIRQHEHQNNHHISNFFHTLWTSGKTRRAQQLHAAQLREKQEKQYVLDDYLESIDRRYKRLRKDDHEQSSKIKTKNKKTENGGGFTNALQWLTAKNPDSVSEMEEQRRQEDAIYVLGLADLASTRLLQRHHLPVPQSKLNESVVIDIRSSLVSESVPAVSSSSSQSGTKSSSDLGTSTTTTTATNLVTQDSKPCIQKTLVSALAITSTVAIHKLLTMVQTLRKMDMSLLADFAVRMNKLTATAVRSGCKSLTVGLASFLSFVTDKSGGKHNVQIASLMITAIFAFAVSFIRPVTKA
jgi:prefoldin subunit 5